MERDYIEAALNALGKELTGPKENVVAVTHLYNALTCLNTRDKRLAEEELADKDGDCVKQ